ncbi:MAG: hypothetical protein WC858_00870 [Parcubacteria group bacterium]|jgi:hypothetical protein
MSLETSAEEEQGNDSIKQWATEEYFDTILRVACCALPQLNGSEKELLLNDVESGQGDLAETFAELLKKQRECDKMFHMWVSVKPVKESPVLQEHYRKKDEITFHLITLLASRISELRQPRLVK